MCKIKSIVFLVLTLITLSSAAQDNLYWEASISRDSLSSETYADTLNKMLFGAWEMSILNRKNCIIGIRLINEVSFNPSDSEVKKALQELEYIQKKAMKLGIPKEMIFLDIREPNNILGPDKIIIIRVNWIHKLVNVK